MHAPFPNEGVWADVGTDKGRGMFIRSIDFASRIGGDRLVIHTSTMDKHEEMIAHSKELVALCDQADIKACFENTVSEDACLRSKESLVEFVKDVPGAYFCFDTSHYYMWNKDLESLFDAIQSIQDHIGLIHMVDTFKGQDAHLLPGFGEINLYQLAKVFINIPNIKSIPIVLEDQEPFEYPQGILNLRHALVSKKGLMDRNIPPEEEQE